jgi:hypothetical protein
LQRRVTKTKADRKEQRPDEQKVSDAERTRLRRGGDGGCGADNFPS